MKLKIILNIIPAGVNPPTDVTMSGSSICGINKPLIMPVMMMTPERERIPAVPVPAAVYIKTMNIDAISAHMRIIGRSTTALIKVNDLTIPVNPSANNNVVPMMSRMIKQHKTFIRN